MGENQHRPPSISPDRGRCTLYLIPYYFNYSAISTFTTYNCEATLVSSRVMPYVAVHIETVICHLSRRFEFFVLAIAEVFDVAA